MENRKYSYELFVAGLTDINCVDKDGVNEAIKWLEDNKIPYSYIELAKASSELIKCKDNSKYIKINYEGQRAFIKLIELVTISDKTKYNYQVYENEIKEIVSTNHASTPYILNELIKRFNINNCRKNNIAAIIEWMYSVYEPAKDDLEKLGYNKVSYADAITNEPFMITYANDENGYNINISENSIVINDKNSTFEFSVDEFKALSEVVNDFCEK